jgi:hypothetical protein
MKRQNPGSDTGLLLLLLIGGGAVAYYFYTQYPPYAVSTAPNAGVQVPITSSGPLTMNCPGDPGCPGNTSITGGAIVAPGTNYGPTVPVTGGDDTPVPVGVSGMWNGLGMW